MTTTAIESMNIVDILPQGLALFTHLLEVYDRNSDKDKVTLIFLLIKEGVIFVEKFSRVLNGQTKKLVVVSTVRKLINEKNQGDEEMSQKFTQLVDVAIDSLVSMTKSKEFRIRSRKFFFSMCKKPKSSPKNQEPVAITSRKEDSPKDSSLPQIVVSEQHEQQE